MVFIMFWFFYDLVLGGYYITSAKFAQLVFWWNVPRLVPGVLLITGVNFGRWLFTWREDYWENAGI